MKGGMGGKGNSTGGGRTMERSRRLDEDELKKHEDVIMVSVLNERPNLDPPSSTLSILLYQSLRRRVGGLGWRITQSRAN